MQAVDTVLGLAVGVQGWAVYQLVSGQVTPQQRPWVVRLGTAALLVIGVVGLTLPPLNLGG